jgi:NAD(P)-dependent dehydrogenase (short-subunit alcohol dehydrogenase family)
MAFALALARRGYAILLHYHASADEAGATVEEVRSLGVPVYPVGADLTTEAGLETIGNALAGLPHLWRVLVNSAAVMPRRDLRILPADEWDATFAINLRAPFRLGQLAAEHMTQGGLIVNVTDVGAQKAWSGFPAYTVSKAALESLTRVQARAFAPVIRVNAIAPGLVLPASSMRAGEWDRLVGQTPLKRPISIDEVAAALDFLLDNEAVTGQVLTVDGGYAIL